MEEQVITHILERREASTCYLQRKFRLSLHDAREILEFVSKNHNCKLQYCNQQLCRIRIVLKQEEIDQISDYILYYAVSLCEKHNCIDELLQVFEYSLIRLMKSLETKGHSYTKMMKECASLMKDAKDMKCEVDKQGKV